MNLNTLSRRLFFLRSEIDRMLTVSILFSLLLVAVAMFNTHFYIFLFLVWNLFLAYIPYAISNWLQQHPAWIENKWKFTGAFLLWLLFIPNSFYIVTDIFHLKEVNNIPLWYELMVLVSFAWNGLLLGLVSLRQMERLFELEWGASAMWKFTVPVIALNSLGVYIGRYLRYNSWDVFVNPLALFSDMMRMIVHPLQTRLAWGMIVCFTLFMCVVYFTLKRLAKQVG